MRLARAEGLQPRTGEALQDAFLVYMESPRAACDRPGAHSALKRSVGVFARWSERDECPHLPSHRRGRGRDANHGKALTSYTWSCVQSVKGMLQIGGQERIRTFGDLRLPVLAGRCHKPLGHPPKKKDAFEAPWHPS